MKFIQRIAFMLATGYLGATTLLPPNAFADTPPETKFIEATPLPLDVPLKSESVRYIGRFDWRDSGGPRAEWSASSVALKFRGTALNVKCKDGGKNRWQVEIDGAPTSVLQLQTGEHWYRAAENLPDAPHTLRLVKATEAFVGATQWEGLQLNAGAQLLPRDVPTRRIEVIGDSISAGYGNEASSKDEHFTPQTENAYFTYGAIAARQLKADYTCIAWSGRKMWPKNTVPEIYDLTLPQDPGSTWDFTAPAPDVVLINLATNDFNGGNPDETGWTEAYRAFIARLRTHYPHAQIYCAIGPMMGDWGDGKPLTTLRAYLAKILDTVHAEGDTKVHLIDFGMQDSKNGLGADWHPNVKTHQIMAAQLVETLQHDLKW